MRVESVLADLVRAAGGDPEMVGDPMAYLLTVIAERDALKRKGGGASRTKTSKR